MINRVILLMAIVLCHVAAGQTLPDAESIADKQSYLKDLSELLRAQWPHNRTVTIVCHGHSVPAGYFKTPTVRMLDAYPHLLHEQLCERFPTAVINVIVTAIGGEDSVQGEKRFKSDVLALHPDVVTIDYGLNDRRIGLGSARRAWSSMIESAQGANVKVILLTPTPDLTANLNDPDDPLNQHARQIRTLAAAYHVGLVDSLALFSKSIQDGVKLQDLMAQSNHPNRRGHELVAQDLATWFAR